MFITNDLIDLIGKTPMLELTRLFPGAKTRISHGHPGSMDMPYNCGPLSTLSLKIGH